MLKGLRLNFSYYWQRDDPERPEDQVLMRALRDYNVPKIVTDDVPVFMGLIGDLFPALDVPRKKDQDFEKAVKEAAVDLKLQPEDSFILKVKKKCFVKFLSLKVLPSLMKGIISQICNDYWTFLHLKHSKA